MKKLLAAVIMSVAAIGTAQAKPSINGGHNISNFCSTFGKAAAGIYVLKEQGYEKQYVISAMVNEGINKDTVVAAADTAYELKSGMNRNYVQQRVTKFCISSLSKMEAEK